MRYTLHTKLARATIVVAAGGLLLTTRLSYDGLTNRAFRYNDRTVLMPKICLVRTSVFV
jgi:hypothetical protein